MGLIGFGGLATTAISETFGLNRLWLVDKTFDARLTLCQIIPNDLVMQHSTYIGLMFQGCWEVLFFLFDDG